MLSRVTRSMPTSGALRLPSTMNALAAGPNTISVLAAGPNITSRLGPLASVACVRTKVILPAAHPFEYFRDDWNAQDPRLPQIPHPQQQPTADGRPRPLYFKITLRRSLLGLPWNKRYAACILFKKYAPVKRYKPTKVDARISTNTVIFREASTEVADLIVQLKEILQVENVWTVEEYRSMGKQLLGKQGLTAPELQARRGYYVVGSAGRFQKTSTVNNTSSATVPTASTASSTPSSTTPNTRSSSSTAMDREASAVPQ